MESKPQKGNEVEIKYTLKTKGGTVIDTTSSKPNFRFIIGSGKVYKEIEDKIMQMTKGEKGSIELEVKNNESVLGVQVPQGESIDCEIELIDYYEKIKSVFEMDVNEKVAIAKKEKEEGVDEFKKGEYGKARNKFKEGLGYIEKIPNKDMTKEIEEMKISFLLNMCNCLNRIKDYPETIKLVKSVIEIKSDNAKAYYYRGVAYANLDEYDQANEDYSKLSSLVPDISDPGIVALRNLIDTRQKDKEAKEKSKVKALFKKGLFDNDSK